MGLSPDVSHASHKVFMQPCLVLVIRLFEILRENRQSARRKANVPL